MDIKRIIWLDGVRGLAAFAVAFSHLLSTQNFGWPQTILSYTSYPIINIFWNGPAAVSIFFVLSGYVLTLGVRKNVPLNSSWFKGFVIGRITRIALPFWGAMLFSIALFYMAYNGGYWSSLSNNFLSKEWGEGLLASQALIQQSLLILPNTEHTLVPQGWTLTVELQISLLIPLIFFALVRSPIIAVSGMIIIGILLHQTFVVHFLLGMLLAIYHHQVSDFIETLSLPLKWFSFISGLILLTLVWYVEEKPFEIARWVINGLGAVIIIAVGSHLKQVVNTFKSVPLHFLGRISYSFYLTHMAVYLTLLPYIYHFSQTSIILLTLLVAILCGTAFYYFIELPSIKVGHLLKNRSSVSSKA